MTRRHWVLAIGVAIAAVSLYLSLRGTDFRALAGALAGVRFSLVPLIVLALAGFYGLKAFRWRSLLASAEPQPSAATLAGPMMIGFAANNLLPFRLGEIIRMLTGSQRTGIGNGAILASIVVERVFDVITLLLLAAAAWAWDGGRSMAHPLLPYAAAFAALAAGGLLLLAFAQGPVFAVLRRRAVPGGTGAMQAVLRKLLGVEAGLRAIRSPARVAGILLNSTVQWLLLAVAILLACQAANVSVGLPTALFLLLLITIAISIPSTPGFVGVIEYSFVLGLGAAGIASADALAAAVVYHVTAWVSVTATGTWFLHRYSLQWGEVAAEGAGRAP